MKNASKILPYNCQTVAEELTKIDLKQPLCVVSDVNTARAYGFFTSPPFTHCAHYCYETPPVADLGTAQQLAEKLCDFKSVLAIGSGTINDLCKYAAHLCHIDYAVLASAPSMNGYVSPNASLYDEGYKKSFAATPPVALFYDETVIASAPKRLIASGIGDTLCLYTLIQDVWLSHHWLGTEYNKAMFAYLFQKHDNLLITLEKNDISCIAPSLMDALIASGFAMQAARSSAPASQGEHMIAHVLEMLDPGLSSRHYHGEIIAVTTLTMMRLQERLKNHYYAAFQFAPFPFENIKFRFGRKVALYWQEEYTTKRNVILRNVQENYAYTLTPRLAAMTSDRLERIFKDAGCPTSAADLGIDDSTYQNAVTLAPFTRNRFTWLDIAAAARAI